MVSTKFNVNASVWVGLSAAVTTYYAANQVFKFRIPASGAVSLSAGVIGGMIAEVKRQQTPPQPGPMTPPKSEENPEEEMEWTPPPEGIGVWAHDTMGTHQITIEMVNAQCLKVRSLQPATEAFLWQNNAAESVFCDDERFEQQLQEVREQAAAAAEGQPWTQERAYLFLQKLALIAVTTADMARPTGVHVLPYDGAVVKSSTPLLGLDYPMEDGTPFTRPFSVDELYYTIK